MNLAYRLLFGAVRFASGDPQDQGCFSTPNNRAFGLVKPMTVLDLFSRGFRAIKMVFFEEGWPGHVRTSVPCFRPIDRAARPLRKTALGFDTRSITLISRASFGCDRTDSIVGIQQSVRRLAYIRCCRACPGGQNQHQRPKHPSTRPDSETIMCGVSRFRSGERESAGGCAR